jgi:hypothetical protein
MKVEMTNRRFGRWVVLREIGRNERKDVLWFCRCDCGSEKVVLGGSLRKGASKSCGCITKERLTKHGDRNPHATTKAYRAWHSMIQRCRNPNGRDWKDYGGRGITVCPAWQASYVNFKKDMGEPQLGRSLDRIDTNGDYEPSNCRWSTAEQQQNNRRCNRVVAYNGEKVSIGKLARIVGVNRSKLYMRIIKYDWPVERAIVQ